MSRAAADVVVFACNWDGLSCVEAASQMGLRYPASVNVVRVSCLSRVHSGLMLKAFELGADGVMLVGCETGKCHFHIDPECVAQEREKARGVMALLGMGEGKLVLARMPCGDGRGFVSRLTNFIAEIERIQPTTCATA